MWYLYRLGKITGSMMHKVWQGDVNNPAKSTWKKICKGRSGSEESQRRLAQNADVKRGRENEEKARNEYENVQKQSHDDFELQLSGLVLHSVYPFIGSSPDACVSCDYCPGLGCVEIKCPREENMSSCLDENGELDKEHSYYFQVQTHMLVTDASYCDLYLWINTNDSKNPLKNPSIKPKIVRVLQDVQHQEKMVSKCKDYFLYVILPEMVSHWYTRASNQQQPLQPRNDNLMLPNICHCKAPRRDPMIICSGTSCQVKEFHCRCVGLITALKRKKWYCAQCLPSAPKRRQRKRANIVGEDNLSDAIPAPKARRRRTESVNNENLTSASAAPPGEREEPIQSVMRSTSGAGFQA